VVIDVRNMEKTLSPHIQKILTECQKVGSFGVNTLYYDLEMCSDIDKIMNTLKNCYQLQATNVTNEFMIEDPHRSHIIIQVTGFPIKISCIDQNVDINDVIEKCKKAVNEGKDYILYQVNPKLYYHLKNKLIEQSFTVQDLGQCLHEELKFIKSVYMYKKDVYTYGCEAVHHESNRSMIEEFINNFDSDKLSMRISGWNNEVIFYQPYSILQELYQIYDQNKNIVFDGIIQGCKSEATNPRDHYGFYKIGYDEARLKKWIKKNGFGVYVEDPCSIAIRGWYYYHPRECVYPLLQELQDIYYQAEAEMYIKRLPEKYKKMAESGYIDHCELVGSKIAPQIVIKLNELGYRSWIWSGQYILTDWNHEINPKFGYRTQNTYTGEMSEWNKVTVELLNRWTSQPISPVEKELHRLVIAFELDNQEKLVRLIHDVKDDINKNGYFHGCPSSDYAIGMNRIMLNYFLNQPEYTVEKYRTYADFLSYTHGIEIKKKQ